MKTERVEQMIETRDGIFAARYSELGLAELNFPKSAAKEKSARSPKKAGQAHADNGSAPQRRQVAAWHRLATAALKRVLAGKPPKNLPPMDWTGSTEFQQAVWRQMLKLRPGQTLSYAEIAQAIGRPKAVRAVGGACGANPIPVLVPCHRVLAANRKLGGFSGGLDWKRRLLASEGVALYPPPTHRERARPGRCFPRPRGKPGRAENSRKFVAGSCANCRKPGAPTVAGGIKRIAKNVHSLVKGG